MSKPEAIEATEATWVTKMKILAVVFGSGLTDVSIDNWELGLVKLEKSIDCWTLSCLSLVGKSSIINTLGISKLICLTSSSSTVMGHRLFK